MKRTTKKSNYLFLSISLGNIEIVRDARIGEKAGLDKEEHAPVLKKGTRPRSEIPTSDNSRLDNRGWEG